MEKDSKILLGAFLILVVAMFSSNLSTITGKVSAQNSELPDLVGDAYFADLNTGEKIAKAYAGDKVDIIVKISNVGNGEAIPGDLKNKVSHRLEIKKDGIRIPERSLRKTFNLDNIIPAKGFVTKHLRYISPGYRFFQFNAPGEYCLDIKVDTGKRLAEIDEDNEFKGINCVTVTDEGKSAPEKKEAAKKSKKEKTPEPSILTLELLGYYRDDISDTESDLTPLRKETCNLKGKEAVSCSFKADFETGANYVVRGSTSTNDWEVRYVRIIDSANQEFTRKVCGKPFCELNTADFFKPKTKNDQLIKAGEYLIEGNAEIS